jgi:hypothetical protein
VEKLEIGRGRKTNLIFHLTHIPNQRISPGLTYNQEKHLMRKILSGLRRRFKKWHTKNV